MHSIGAIEIGHSSDEEQYAGDEVARQGKEL